MSLIQRWWLVNSSAPLPTAMASMGNSSYVGLWHTADVQRLPALGPLTGALPKFEAQCRLTAAFQTLRHAVLKVAV